MTFFFNGTDLFHLDEFLYSNRNYFKFFAVLSKTVDNYCYCLLYFVQPNPSSVASKRKVINKYEEIMTFCL